jgi:hypothetical protein
MNAAVEELKRQKQPISSSDGIGKEMELEIREKSKEAGREFLGHGSKTIDGFVRLMWGMGNRERGLYAMPFTVSEHLADSGFGSQIYGAASPYMDTPLGLIFHKSNGNAAVAAYVHPSSGLFETVRRIVPPAFPVVETQGIPDLLNELHKKVKNGVYTGPKVNIFSR